MPPSLPASVTGPMAAAALPGVVAKGLRQLSQSLAAEKYDGATIARETQRALAVAQIAAQARDEVLPRIDPPLLITGFGRTGSTHLLQLLAADPQLRAANLWELWRPAPPPRPGHRDYRISLARQELRCWSPEQLRLHPMHAERPDECYWLIPHQHCHALAYNAASYCEWMHTLCRDDLISLYSCYRDNSRLLMRHFPHRRWIGKCLAHMHFAPVLHEVFPRATLIRLHRDPAEAVASYCGLIAAFTKSAFPARDPFQSRGLVVDTFASGARRMLQAAPSIRCIDVRYADLVADPVGTIDFIYTALDRSAPDAVRAAAMRAATTPDARRRRASLSDAGLERRRIARAMDGYLAWARQRWGPDPLAEPV